MMKGIVNGGAVFLVRRLGLGRGVVMSWPSGDRGISLRWDEMAETRGWFADIA